MCKQIWMALALMFVTGWTQATPAFLNAGLGGYSAAWDCRLLVAGGCRSAAVNPSGFDTFGSQAYTSASAVSNLVDPLRGVANTSAIASTTSYLPELHAYASSNGAYSPDRGNANPALYTGVWSAFADANTWGVQGYQYNGAAPFELVLTITLDTHFTISGDNDRIGHSFYSAGIFGTAGYDFNRDSTCPTYIRAALDCPTVTVFDNASGFVYDTGRTTSVLHYVLDPGDTFYVGAFLDAHVCCDGTVDSSHTLTMSFNDASNLSSFAVAGVLPLATGVDEPPGLSLTLVGLGLLALWVRRWPAGARL